MTGQAATDYVGMQQVFLQGRAAATFQDNSWMCRIILAGTASRPFAHIAPPPLVVDADRARPILAWAGFALPSSAVRSRDAAYMFLEYGSRPDIDPEVTAWIETYSPMDASKGDHRV